MFNISLDFQYKIENTGGNSGEFGSQGKYFNSNYWYKEDLYGCEGLIEYLISLILRYSSLSVDDYVVYEQGKINGKAGCRSRNFLSSGESFITLQKAYKKVTGKNLWEDTFSILDLNNRVDLVLSFFRNKYRVDLENYFKKVFTLDLLSLNEDRHFNNLGFIAAPEGIRHAPLFDNGLSLLNGNKSILSGLSIEENVKRVTSKPFSGSPEKQFKTFCGTAREGIVFTLDYIGIFKELKSMSGFYVDVLKYQLLKYRKLFFKYTKHCLIYKGQKLGTRFITCKGIYDTHLIGIGYDDYDSLIEKDGVYYTQDELLGKVQPMEIDSKLVLELL